MWNTYNPREPKLIRWQVYLAYETLANPEARRKYDLGRVKTKRSKAQKKPRTPRGKSLGLGMCCHR